MKIRIEGNSIRVRLRKSELDKLLSLHKISETVNFANSKLKYSIQIADKFEVLEAQYHLNEIQIKIPKNDALQWISTDLVGIENNDTEPSILLEKDFKCTSIACEESQKDQSDFFENPKENVGR